MAPQNITMHIAAVYEEGELSEEATCKRYLQVREEGGRHVRRVEPLGSAVRAHAQRSQPGRQSLWAHGLVEHGEHDHPVILDDVEDGVGELPHHRTPDRALDGRVGVGVVLDQGQRALDRIDEPSTAAGFLALMSALGGVYVIDRRLAQQHRWVHRRNSLRLASSQVITASGSSRCSASRRRSAVRCSSETGGSNPSSRSGSHSAPMSSRRSLGASRSGVQPADSRESVLHCHGRI